MSNTIKLKKYSDVIEEYVAGGAITPGMLVAYNSDKKVVAHATGNAVPMFALEDELQGKGIDEAYAEGAPVQVWVPYRGDHVNALVTGAEIVAGDSLQSAGDGTLEKWVDTIGDDPAALPGVVVAQALVGVTPADATVRLAVRIV